MSGNNKTKIPFTKYEAALLLDAYLQTIKGRVSRRAAITNCSQQLRQLGRNNGIAIDDIYRNVNGITFQMESMESAYVGHTMLKPASRLFNEIVALYRNDNNEYRQILTEAKQMSKIETASDAFINWLSTQVSPAQLSELYMVYLEINDFAKREKLVEDSLWENPDPQIINYICMEVRNNRYFTSTHKQQMSCIDSVLRFIVEYSNTHSTPTEAFEPILDNSKELQPETVRAITHSDSANSESVDLNDSDQSDHVKIVDFSLSNNMAFTKPVSFTYFGETTEEKTWGSLYKDICRMLAEDYPHVFQQICMNTISGSEKLWMVNKANIYKLTRPAQIGDDLFVETNRSASDLVRNIGLLLNQCLIDHENVEVRYISSGSEKPVQETPGVRRYLRDDKEQFYEWMINDRHMSERTCRSYISNIRGAERFAADHHYSHSSLYSVSLEEATATVKELYSDPEFVTYDKEQHNRFRAAITKLLEFLGGSFEMSSSQENDISNRAVVADIDKEPYRKTLEAHFPNGYRLNSSIESRKFRRYYEELNGYAADEDNKEVERLIRSCGIEYDGRVYMPESMLSVEVKDEVITYIDKRFEEGASMVYFEALFHQFYEKFLDYRIYDANMLRLYIARVTGNKYVIERNYLSLKHIAEAEPIDEIRNCLKENVLPLQIDELSKRLPHIPKDRIRTILGTNLEFVRNSKGEYFHADSFDVRDEELDDIAAVIDDELRKNGFISGNELYYAIKRKFPYIYEKNAVFSAIGWRDALKYKFGGKYSFNGNVISPSGKSLSMSDVFRNFGKNRQSFSLEEVQQLVESIGSKVIYFDALYEYSARISEEKFVRKDYVSFKPRETDSVIDRFCPDDFAPITVIRNFGIFPDASYPWNEYLLENYLAFHSERYKLLHTGYNINTVVGAVVRRSAGINDYDELLAMVIANSVVSLKKEAALSYLVDQGYIGRRSYKNIESILINARAIRNRKEK